MCSDCYDSEVEDGFVPVMNDNVKICANLIKKVYDFDGCGCGGYAHIVFDDWNYSDGDIDFCINEIGQSRDFIDVDSEEPTRQALLVLKSLSIDERLSALALVDGIITA